jgi:hypothetical protein
MSIPNQAAMRHLRTTWRCTLTLYDIADVHPIVELLACVLLCGRQASVEEYRSLLNDPKQTQLREDSVDGGPGKKKNTNSKMHTSEFGMFAHYKPPMVPSNHLPKDAKKFRPAAKGGARLGNDQFVRTFSVAFFVNSIAVRACRCSSSSCKCMHCSSEEFPSIPRFRCARIRCTAHLQQVQIPSCES